MPLKSKKDRTKEKHQKKKAVDKKLSRCEQKYAMGKLEKRRKQSVAFNLPPLVTRSPKKLWSSGARRAFCTGIVVEVLRDLNKRAHLFGTSRYASLPSPNADTTSTGSNTCKVSPSDLLQLIHPDHKFRQAWEVVMGVILVYASLVVPFRVAFQNDTPPLWMATDIIIELCFFLDIVIHFFSGFRER